MKNTLTFGLATLLLTACATTPSPEKICSAEWIAPRAEKAVDRIEKKTVRAIKTLKRAGNSLTKGKSPGVFTMMGLSSAFESLEYEFTKGPGMRDLKTIAQTCDDPEVITKSMRKVFKNQGVSDDVFDFIEALPLYQNMLERNLSDVTGLTEPETL